MCGRLAKKSGWRGTPLRDRRPAHDHLRDTIRLSRRRGGGGIRTPGACARRFSRPLPSTTRPLLQAVPEAGGIYRDRFSFVKQDLGFPPDHAYLAIRSSPPTYDRSAGGTTTLPSACWYCSRIATIVRPIAMPEPFSVWIGRGFSPRALR